MDSLQYMEQNGRIPDDKFASYIDSLESMYISNASFGDPNLPQYLNSNTVEAPNVSLTSTSLSVTTSSKADDNSHKERISSGNAEFLPRMSVTYNRLDRSNSISRAMDSLRTTMRSSSSKHVSGPFIQFCIIGPRKDIFSGKMKPVSAYSQPTQIIDVYPIGEPPIVESIPDFCFPRGCTLSIMTPSAAAAITGKSNDKMHIAQLSDTQGVPTYVCFLTITERILTKDTILITNLIEMVAVNTIVRFFRIVILCRKSEINNIVESNLSSKMPRSVLAFFRQSFFTRFKKISRSPSNAFLTSTSSATLISQQRDEKRTLKSGNSSNSIVGNNSNNNNNTGNGNSNNTSRSTTPTRIRLGFFGRRESEYPDSMSGARAMLTEVELEDMSTSSNISDLDKCASRCIDARSLSHSLSSKSDSEFESTSSRSFGKEYLKYLYKFYHVSIRFGLFISCLQFGLFVCMIVFA